MEKAERDAILRQGVVLPETPRARRAHGGSRGSGYRLSQLDAAWILERFPANLGETRG